jgi:uncharacterized membrane protein YhaH (DUF805 family)
MNLTQTLFSFNGRIRRSTWWLYSIGLGVVVSVVYGVSMWLMGTGNVLQYIGYALMLVALVAEIWGGLALSVKRWHDRDKSWVWIFIAFVPFIGGLWLLIENGFLDGTQGPNKYGPSPKGITGPAVAAT